MFWEHLYFHFCNGVSFGESMFLERIPLVAILLNLVSQISSVCMCIHIYTLVRTHTAYTHHIYTPTHNHTELKPYVEA